MVFVITISRQPIYLILLLKEMYLFSALGLMMRVNVI